MKEGEVVDLNFIFRVLKPDFFLFLLEFVRAFFIVEGGVLSVASSVLPVHPAFQLLLF